MLSFKAFLSDDSGAVAVNWIVLTAAVMSLTLAVMAVIATGTEDLTGELQADLANIDPPASPFVTDTQGDGGAVTSEQ